MNDAHKWITKEEAQKRIAIDCCQTLVKGSGRKVHWQDKDALQRLRDKGHYLILLSYCGVERSWPGKVEVKDPKSQKHTTTEAPVMLPHLLFSSLY